MTDLLQVGDVIRLVAGMQVNANIPEKFFNDDKPFSSLLKIHKIEIGRIYHNNPFNAYQLKEALKPILEENLGVEASDSQIYDLLDSLPINYDIEEYDTSYLAGEYVVSSCGMPYPTKMFLWPVYCYKKDNPEIKISFWQRGGLDDPIIHDIRAIDHIL